MFRDFEYLGQLNDHRMESFRNMIIGAHGNRFFVKSHTLYRFVSLKTPMVFFMG